MTDTSDFTPDWPPNWTNAPRIGFRSYSSVDSVLIQTDGVFRCAVSSFATTFISVFGPAFMVFFSVVCWVGIDDFRERVGIMTIGFFCGTATIWIFYALMKHHQERGDYVVVDSKRERIELPRHNRVFNQSDIKCLQLLTGRDKDAEAINHSDLNLLVADGDDVVRYHLIGNPNKKHAREIAKAMRTPLIEQNVPSGWYRSSDRQNNV